MTKPAEPTFALTAPELAAILRAGDALNQAKGFMKNTPVSYFQAHQAVHQGRRELALAFTRFTDGPPSRVLRPFKLVADLLAYRELLARVRS